MASIILTVDAASAQRISAAFGKYWGLTDSFGAPRDATLTEVKAHLVSVVKSVVRDQEKTAALAQAATGVTDVPVT